MRQPKEINEVVLDGHLLSLEEFIAVSRFHAVLKIGENALEKMRESRRLVEKIADENRVAYGITTGFGDLAKVAVDHSSSNTLATNLVLSHCVATGDPYTEEQVRGMMLLLANSLSHGYSGCRPVLAEMLCDMLNKNVIPVVPQKGSLGASGDLAPLSHIALVLLGKGKAYFDGESLEGKDAMERAGMETLPHLVHKEGLALSNGTHAMTSLAALNLYDAMNVLMLADMNAAMSFSVLEGQLNAYDARIHEARGQSGQMKTAEVIRRLTAGSSLVQNAQGKRVQDAYSLRCVPQVHGACQDAIEYVKNIVERELNAVTDNPLLFTEDESVISGGNFHGEPIALAMDFLGIAVSELASISERRLERMVNPALSNGLTPFLTVNAGINSGYMIVQYSAASMVSENKVLAHPASVDSIPSSANQEDFVSMATTAARKCVWILQNTTSVLAYELLTACQAKDIREYTNPKAGELSPVLKEIYERVRKDIPFTEKDREIRIDIEKIESLMRSGELEEIIRKYMPDLQ
ncbi:MAG: histidine ammonia-lyase [Erysipelotrichales bacterium]|nr:histidine ammonia-lyase [Erysipelotrichales bacterium]